MEQIDAGIAALAAILRAGRNAFIQLVRRPSTRRPFTLFEREMRRQGAKDAKGAKKKTMPGRLDGSKFRSLQVGSTRLSL
ncbi:hypothetical protein [Sorangium sp. So ce131]|uniref:hypothetical protein n=1 Tax=Sorangium sp. So ce131 TaxID=3133282 RepID=UPI003F634951